MSLELYFTVQVLHSVTCDELHAFPFTNSLVLECERTEAEPVPLPVGSIVCDCSQPSMCCSPVGQKGVYSLILLHALESCLGLPKTSGGCGRSAIQLVSACLIRLFLNKGENIQYVTRHRYICKLHNHIRGHLIPGGVSPPLESHSALRDQ